MLNYKSMLSFRELTQTRKNSFQERMVDISVQVKSFWANRGNRIFFFFFLKMFIYLFIFIYLWLCWVFISVWGLPLVATSGGHSSSWCAGLSLSWPLLLRSTDSRRAGSVIVAHGPSCSAACEIFPDQGSNPCPLHWQADSQPLRHQGSPEAIEYWRTKITQWHWKYMVRKGFTRHI